MTRPAHVLVLAALVAPIAVDGTDRPRVDEGRAPTPSELVPSVEAAFAHESYAPGATATLVLANRAEGIRMQVFRSGVERRLTRSDRVMNGVPVTPVRPVGQGRRGRTIQVRIGTWPSGLYFARLRAADGRVGFAPFVVRPRVLGEHRVAVVMPTLTWQAYNLRDEDGDGAGDSWYAEWRTRTVRLGRPFLSRGVPYNFRRYDLPFLNWLARRHKKVDVLAQADLSSVSPYALRRAYSLIVFPGHHEYVTEGEYDAIEGYRSLGGNLMFLSANNFFWEVVIRGMFMTKTKLWRDLDRPEAALIGVQYLANGKAPRRPWIVRRAPAASWVFTGTGLRTGSTFARGGVEIDRIAAATPAGVQVLAEIPNLFGAGKTAQMTYYEHPSGAQVFAAGAFYFTRMINLDPVVSRIVENLWARMGAR